MVISDTKLFSQIVVALDEYSRIEMSSLDASDVGYNLIALVPNVGEEKYTLLISTYWLDEGYEEFDVIDNILPYLRKNLSGEIYKINNIAVINSSDLLVKTLSENYPHIDKHIELFDITIGSNHFDKIHILKTS